MALYVKKISNDFIRRIAQEYLTDFATMKKLAKLHNTSPGTISNLLFKGVSEEIIDEITSNAIVDKVTNSTENFVRTDRRWKKALEIRKIPSYEAEIVFLKHKLEELEFQLETYEDYFSDEKDAPSKAYIKASIKKIQGEIQGLRNYIEELRG